MPDVTLLLTRVDSDGLAALRDALAGSGLPFSDIDAPGGRQFFAGRVGGRTVGYIGLEIHGTDALVRSLVVFGPERGKGFGSALVRRALEVAAAQGVACAWALTMSAAPLLQDAGFQPVDRAAAPLLIQATTEFATLCPATAVCMMRSI